MAQPDRPAHLVVGGRGAGREILVNGKDTGATALIRDCDRHRHSLTEGGIFSLRLDCFDNFFIRRDLYRPAVVRVCLRRGGVIG